MPLTIQIINETTAVDDLNEPPKASMATADDRRLRRTAEGKLQWKRAAMPFFLGSECECANDEATAGDGRALSQFGLRP